MTVFMREQANGGPVEVVCGARAVLPPGRLAVLSLPLFYAAPAAWPSATQAAGPSRRGQDPSDRPGLPAGRQPDQGPPRVAAGPVSPAGSRALHTGSPNPNDLPESDAAMGGATAVPADRAASALEATAACAGGPAHLAFLGLAGAVVAAGTAVFPL